MLISVAAGTAMSPFTAVALDVGERCKASPYSATGIRVVTHHGWEITINWGGWQVISAPASAEATANGHFSIKNSVPEDEFGDPLCPCIGVDSVYGVSEVDPPVTDSADLVNRDIHAVAHVFTNGEEIEGGCAIHFGVSGGSYTAYHAALGRTEYRSPDCVCIGVRDHSGFTTGFGSLSRSYGLTRVGPDDMSYSRRHTYENGIIIWLPSPCVGEGGGGDPPPPPELVKVDTTTMLTSIEHSDASVTNHHLQGVIAYYSDGSTVRLGMYASPAYAPVATTPSTPNTLEFSTSVDETFVITVPHDAVGLQDFVFSEAFEQFDGDMNGDGSVCWTDRKLFVDALGSTIGDGRYRARGDFDLDGDVDAADYAAYVAEFAARASCTSDYDCGGSVNSSDTSAFLTAWNADVTNGTLYADFDGNGTTNSADISAFLAQWSADISAGC